MSKRLGGRGRAALLLYGVSLLVMVADYSVLPRLFSSMGLAGKPGIYYAGVIGLTAVMAVMVVLLARYLGMQTIGPRLNCCQHGNGVVLRSIAGPAAVALGVGGGFALIAAVLGYRPTSVAGPLGALLLSAIYAGVAIPLTYSILAASKLGDADLIAAVGAGLAALNPVALAVTLRGGGPSALVSGAAYLLVGMALGLVGLSLYRRGGFAVAYSAVLSAIIVVAALPVAVRLGALGTALAGLSGLYAGYLVSGILYPPSASVERGSSNDGGTAVEGGSVASPNMGTARRSKRGLGGGKGVRGLLGNPLFWALIAVAVVLSSLAAMGIMFWRPLVVVTGSMKPVINPGDVVILKHVEGVRVGDIVAYDYKGITITHRVFQVYDNGSFVTKGDANDAPDPYLVPRDALIGRVWTKIPLVGWAVILATWNPIVKVAVIAAATAAIIAVIIKW